MLESHLIKDYKNLSELNRNPENPRDIDEKELTMLRKSLDKFGDLSGFVVNVVSGNLVSGNQRSKVLPSVSKIEITERYEKPNAKGTIAIGYVVVDGEKHKYREVLFDEATEKAANIAANQQGGNFNLPALKEWVMELDELSIDLDLLGFKDDFLQTLIAPIHQGGMCDEDEVPEPPKESISKLGDLFKLGEHRLLCGDSTNIQHVEQLMNNEKADMVFTDPPYNVGSDSVNFAKDVSKSMKSLSEAKWDQNFEIEPPILNAITCSKDSATFYIWTSHYLFNRIIETIKPFCDFTSYMVWNKPNPMPSLSKRHPTWNTELCVYGTRGTKRVVNFPNGEHFTSCRTVTKKSDGTHPTQKPIELIQPLIEFSSGVGQSIIDLFGGSGSTLIACEKTNRKCFMMELDPHYVDVIIKRFIQYANKPVFRINDDGIETDITAEFFI